MASKVDEFLKSLRAKYPQLDDKFFEGLKNQYPRCWHIVASVGFGSSNMADGVPLVFAYALKDRSDHAEKLKLVRSIREALFKSSMVSGLPRCIQALTALHAATPEDLRESEYLRDPKRTMENLISEGQKSFDKTYGTIAKEKQQQFKDIFPDFEYFSIAIVYGLVYDCKFVTALLEKEFSYCMITSMIATNAPTQAGWHLQGAINNGATYDEVVSVRKMSIKVVRAAGVPVDESQVPPVPHQ